MRLKWSFLNIPVQGIKSFYPVESFRDFQPFSRGITENVGDYNAKQDPSTTDNTLD